MPNTRSSVWVPRPLYRELCDQGLFPETRQRGDLVNVTLPKPRAKQLRRIVRQYKAELSRYSRQAASQTVSAIIEDFAA